MDAWMQILISSGVQATLLNGRGSFTPLWFRHCWNFPGITVSVRAPFRVMEISLEWLHCIKPAGISRSISSACCHLHTYVLVALNLPLHSSGLTWLSFWAKISYQQDSANNKYKHSSFFQLNPALNPVWISDLFNLPMFIWSIPLPRLQLLPKERAVISCGACTAGVNELLNNWIPVFIDTFLGVETPSR